MRRFIGSLGLFALALVLAASPQALAQGDPPKTRLEFKVTGLTDANTGRLQDALTKSEAVGEVRLAQGGTFQVVVKAGQTLDLEQVQEIVAQVDQSIEDAEVRLELGSVMLWGEVKLTFSGVSDEAGNTALASAIAAVAGLVPTPVEGSMGSFNVNVTASRPVELGAVLESTGKASPMVDGPDGSQVPAWSFDTACWTAAAAAPPAGGHG